MRNFTTRIQNKANALALRARMALSNQRGDFYISDAVKIIIWDQPFTLPTFGWLLASIVIATSLRFGLQMKGQKYAAVASAAIIMVLEPLLK